MAVQLDGKPIAFLVANEGVEQVELTEPWGSACTVPPRTGPTIPGR